MANTLKVCLDPGHKTKYNSGCVKGYYEGDAMFKLALYQKAELEKYEGVTVLMTKTKVEECPEVYDRGRFAATNKCDVFISDHSNAYSPNSSACGVSLFRSVRRPDSVDLGKKIGDAIVETMKAVTGNTYFRSNGPTIRKSETSPGWDYYGVLKGVTSNDAVKFPFLIEHGFHTNPQECNFLYNDENLKKLAVAEVKVIAEYFDLTLKSSSNASSSTETKPETKVESNTATSSTECPYTEPTKDLKKGATGDGVKWIQWHLNKHGYNLEVDGSFGALTDTAVRDFQGKSNLEKDGWVGKLTRAALKKYNTFEPYKVRVTASSLNYRDGAGTNYKINGTIKKGEIYTIVEEKLNGTSIWGRLKSGAGWISLAYTEKI